MSIENVKNRLDHLNAMANVRVNGEPATEVILSPDTLRAWATDGAVLVEVAEGAQSLRRAISEHVEAHSDDPSYPWPALDIALDKLEALV